jgi:hypothetical protein
MDGLSTPDTPEPEAGASTAVNPLRARLEADRRDLLDLSLRNALLNYQPRVRGLEFAGLDTQEVFRSLVREGRSFGFLAGSSGPVERAEPEGARDAGAGQATAGPRPDLRTTWPAEELSRRLLAVHQAARTAVEEQGVNTLFLALGMLTWCEDEGNPRPLRAPLVLVPVTLTRPGAREPFRMRHDGEDPDVNLSLIEKLRVDFGIALPDAPDWDEADLGPYHAAVAEAVEGRAGWSVNRDAAALGFFSFGKFLMYRDLDPECWPPGQGPDAHPIVRSLLGDGFPDPEDVPADEPNDAGGGDPSDALKLVLDADGSQSLALLEALKGRSLVIQGPPGTGKSQTIANLIADSLGRGKTILFVAEKLAALEVVKRRLDSAGLGPACLELHSQKTGKRAVLEQLRSSLSRHQPTARPAEADRIRRDSLRSRLDAYCAAVNTPIGESGLSPHAAIGEALQLQSSLETAERAPIELPGCDSWSEMEFLQRRDQVERLQSQVGMIGLPSGHPFSACRRRAMEPGDEGRLAERLLTARHAALALRETAAALAAMIRLPVPNHRAACLQLAAVAKRLSEIPRGTDSGSSDAWLARHDEVRSLLAEGTAYAALRRRFDEILLPEAWDSDPTSLRLTFNRLGRRVWRLFSADYRRAIAQLASLCRAMPPGRLDDRLEVLDAIQESRRLKASIEVRGDFAAALFGRSWRGASSDWTELSEKADLFYRLHLDIREGRLPRSVLDLDPDGPSREGTESLARAVESAESAMRAASGRLVEFLGLDEAARFGDEGGLAELPFEELDSLFDRWSRSTGSMAGLTTFNALAERCRADGLGGLAGLAESWPASDRSLGLAFRLAWLQALLRRAFRERPELADFQGVSHDRAIAEFRETDRRMFGHSQSEIAGTLWRKMPRGGGAGQIAVLRRELAKKARHLPVRQLIARAGNAVQAITPVFLMSPLSVAAYLSPGAIDFDLVVFDEASQVRPVDALGALLRGRQAVVVGDSQQLPPTSFFDRLTGEDDADDEEESSSDVESILGLFAAQGAPQSMLRWHYRSRHQSLISVSNREFYDGRLQIFPGPEADRRETGLIYRHVPNAPYDRGRTRTNPVEADAVARTVMAFARAQLARPAHERQTLGVAAFSVAQMQAIVDRLERLRHAAPACEEFFAEGADEPFFVKNLENVQGDERDVIFVSVGYGRGADGSLAFNFGPINGEGGDRRLNVLFTRARIRCEIFTSLTPDDLDSNRVHSRGLRVLRRFLAHARDEQPAGAPHAAPSSTGAALVANVRDALRSSGFEALADVGSAGCRIDLAVLDASRRGLFLLGLPFDGPSYQSAGTARARDRLIPEVLDRLGWAVHRTWSPDWFRDPASELGKTVAAVRCAVESRRESTVTPVDAPPAEAHVDPAPATESETVPPEESGPLDSEEAAPTGDEYRTADLSEDVAGIDLAALPADRLTALVRKVVLAEGPVHESEVIRRIADATGRRRTTPRVQDALVAAVGQAVSQASILRRGEFLWPVGMDQPRVRHRGALPSASRRLELVPPEEIARSIELSVRSSFGIEPDEIPGVACRLLGFPRLSEEMRRRVDTIVEQMIAEERLTRRGVYVSAADQGVEVKQ